MQFDTADFRHLIDRCWSLETARTYSLANPPRGQCSVTALVAQDHFGGDLVKTRVGDGWHFYNLIDGARYDFTASQFDRPLVYEDTPTGRQEAFSDTTRGQYEALVEAFRKACLASAGEEAS